MFEFMKRNKGRNFTSTTIDEENKKLLLENDRMSRMIRCQDDLIESRKREVQNLEKDTISLSESLNTAQEERDILKKQLSLVKTQINKLTVFNDDMQRQCAENASLLAIVQEEVEKKNIYITEVDNRIAELDKELDEKDTEISRLTMLLNMSQTQMEGYKENINMSAATISDLNAEKAQLTQKLNDLLEEKISRTTN